MLGVLFNDRLLDSVLSERLLDGVLNDRLLDGVLNERLLNGVLNERLLDGVLSERLLDGLAKDGLHCLTKRWLLSSLGSQHLLELEVLLEESKIRISCTFLN